MTNLSSHIDHTLLKADATDDQYIQLCKEAKEYRFASVCVPPNQVALAKNELKGSEVSVCTVVGFPFGYSTTETKKFETQNVISLGAHEVDMVIAIDKLKSGDLRYVHEEIQQINDLCIPHNVLLKVIIETSALTTLEKEQAIKICNQVGVDFVKTSTGYGTHGATIEDVKLMRSQAKDSIKIKASGGIKDRKFAEELISNGADRIGTSSGTKIVNE